MSKRHPLRSCLGYPQEDSLLILIPFMDNNLFPVQIMLSPAINGKIESIMMELGLRSKGAVIERILAEVFEEDNN